MINPETYFGRKFDWNGYTCFHFMRDVWLDHTGVDLGQYVQSDNTIRGWSRRFWGEFHNVVGKLIHEIRKPEDPCIVLLRNKTMLPHVGILVGNKLLHLPKGAEVAYQPLDEVVQAGHYTSISYFR